LKPDLANAYYNLAASYRQKKDPQKAYNAMQNVVQLVYKSSADYTKATQELESLRQEIGQTAPTSNTTSTPTTLTTPAPVPSAAVSPKITLPANLAPDSALFYHTHSIMLVPLLSGSGLRIKIIEGMAYGKAIVSTSVGAEGIKAEKGKDLLIADDAESFSNEVIRLLKDPSRKNELERNARAYAEKHFDNKNVVKELVQFYTQLNA
jgi:glycosyltransferase involved in cell wall biosynthesis